MGWLRTLEVAVRAALVQETERDVVLRFSVRDTGIGLPSDRLDLVFNKFAQVDASTTRKYGGTGLGLAICKQLAELMGGTVGVQSEVGRGSEFWFTSRFEKQPREKPTGLTNKDGSARPRATVVIDGPRDWRGTRVRILLAEDNITNQTVALAILGKFGLRADGVANGREALEALRSTPYDLVLMDVQMPEMDGLEATRAIRAADGVTLNRNIPIIAMTARAMKGDRETCIAAGMNDYIVKPVMPAGLSAILDKWIAGKDSSD